ncbi:MAG: type VI secretion system accessory protein TagJ [Pseudomonadota bacterium]
MSSALELLKEGNLDAALSSAKGAVRDDPGEPEGRARLFQLFCLNGEWDRAEAQLDALLTSAMGQAPIWKQFQMLMRLDRQRRECHASANAPAIVGDPEDWMAGFAKSFELHQSGDVEGGAALRQEALDAATPAAGSAETDGGSIAFDWIMDGDARYGPMLEAFLPTEGDYCWVPFSVLTSLRIEKPSQINHFVWAPAHFTWKDGRVLHGFVPTRYDGSESAENPAHTLARGTDWIDAGSDVFTGIGQRTLMSAEDDLPLLEIREARFKV